MFDGAIKTMRANPQATFGLGFLIGAIFLVPSALVSLWLERRTVGPSSNSRDLNDALLLLLPTFASWLSGLLLGGFIAYVVSQAVLGAKAGIAQTWHETRSRILPLIGINLVTWVVIVIALLLTIFVPVFGAAAAGAGEGAAIGVVVFAALAAFALALWLIVRLSMAGPVTVLERQGVFASLGRSWRLTAGRAFWRILGITVLAALVAAIAGALLSVPMSLITDAVGTTGRGPVTSLIEHGVQLVVGAITTPFTAGVGCLLYLDQRIRREALDVTLARAAEQGWGR